MHTVHLALIGCRFESFPDLEYTVSGGIVGGLAYLLIYLMLITSFDAPARAIGAKAWRRLHKTGLYVVGFVFVATLLPEEGQPVFTADRLWFTALTAGAVFIRMTAWLALKKK
jgi:DMSO/TMAO reductase YedYZ heme-binding membrane subunit